MKNKLSEYDINKNVDFFRAREYTKMHKDLRRIGISISYDMGWQKRATGRIYDSLSGHGFFIGCLSKNVVNYGLLNKKCSTCIILNRHSSPFKEHNCLVNWEGSSSAIEAGLALNMVLEKNV